MRHKTQVLVSIFLVFILFQCNLLKAQSTYKVKAAKMTVSGSSTLHDWESEVTQIEWKGIALLQEKKGVLFKDVEVRIPVSSIKSEHGKIMDSKTYDAFNYEKHPFIIYKLSASNAADANSIEAVGTLTMAGLTKPIEMKITTKVFPNGDVQLIGEKKLNMKDFGMDPPTAMMGAIKVGEEVKVSFDLTLTQSKINL